MKRSATTQLAIGIALLFGAVAVMAQSAGAAAAEVPAKSLLDYWKGGGVCMYPIGLCSVAAVGLAIYCAILYKSSRMTQAALLKPLGDALENLDIATAAGICHANPGILTNVLSAGLRRLRPGADVDLAAVEKAMDDASQEEVAQGMKPLGYLSVVTQVAPMFGLLGTVTGMIGAFNKIGLGKMGDPEKLADDIGVAMITTAAGLIVAIPAMFAYFGFKAHFTGNISRISSLLGELT
ncbi:MAG: MotA/TolQ/ExbB proton channel family protein, partial [Kiritimatiellae bacterium]|nr:MotA/TolQ/ExbB proton channel family protein [Kiritimatiellia bacterium]